MVEYRDGARFKKQLSINNINWGNQIKDAVISPLYSSIYDGGISFFPKFELTALNLLLKTGQVPLGNSYASTYYLLEFPTITTPSFGSADLESLNLHLYGKDLNYNDNVTQQEIEIYKFRRALPNGGIFPNPVQNSGSTHPNTSPERPMIASGTYSEGPRIFESFDGFGEGMASAMTPSLYTGTIPSNASTDYYSTEDGYYTMNNAAGWGPQGGNNSDDFGDAVTLYTEDYQGQKVVRYLIIEGDQIVPSLSAAGGNAATGFFGFFKELAIDDPKYSIWRWDWAQAVAHGKESKFVSQQLFRFSADAALTIQADDVDVNVAAELPKYALDNDNTFFDSVDYTKIRRDWTDVDPATGRAAITSVSTPHFSSEGSPSSGQCARFWNQIQLSDPDEVPEENVRQFPNKDKVGYNSIRTVKQIPKPIPMARKSGATEQLDSMRIRMKVKIEDMTKMNKTGNASKTNYNIMSGNNLTRSLVVLLATRPPGDETLGAYLAKLNSGRPFNSFKFSDAVGYLPLSDYSRAYTTTGNLVGANSEYAADDFTISRDGWNKQVQLYDSALTTHRLYSRTNNYNGIAICKVPSGKPVDLNLAHSGSGGAWGPIDANPNSFYLADAAGYNALAPAGLSHVEANSAVDLSEGRFVMFHTGRSYGRFNHFDGIYQRHPSRSDTNISDWTPFVVKAGVVHRRGDEYVLGVNNDGKQRVLNPVIVDEFTIDNFTFDTSTNLITSTYWDGRIAPGMMVTGDNIPYKENLGATVLYHWDHGSATSSGARHRLYVGDYSGSDGGGGAAGPYNALRPTTTGTGSLTFKGAITPRGPNPETFQYLDRDEEGLDLAEQEWFFIDAYINHNDNSDAWLGTGGNLSGQDGQQSTITWVISDSDERVLATQTQCHSGSGGKTGATTTAAAGTSNIIEVSDLTKFSVGDCIAIDNDANSSSMERMIVTSVGCDEHGDGGSTARNHGRVPGVGEQNIQVTRGYQDDTLVSVADAKHIYHVPHSQSNMGHGFPAHLSIWVNNCKVGLGPQTTSDKWGEPAGTVKSFFADADLSSTVDVFIDYISVENFQPNLKNVTPTVHQGVRGNLQITGRGEDPIINTSNIIVGEPIVNSEYTDSDSEREITPTYLVWGANTDIWDGKTNHIFMGGRTAGTPSSFDPTDAAKRIKFTVSTEESDIRFFTFPSQSTAIINSSTASDYTTSRMGFGLVRAGSFIPNRSNNINGTWNAHGINLGTSTASSNSADDNLVDSFTKKGFFSAMSNISFAADPTHLDGSATKSDGKFIKTLNPLMSTKITKITNVKKGEIEVINSTALKSFENDEFIIYRLGHSWNHGGHMHTSGHYYRRGIFIKNLNITKNQVVLEVISGKGMGRKGGNLVYSEYGSALVHEDYLSDLYISPLKYWINCEIYNRDEENGNLLPDINYSHSLICNDVLSPSASTLGLTYDEFKYSDSVIDSSRWSLDTSTDNSVIEVKTDYGFGSLSTSTTKDVVTIDFESGAGYIRKQELIQGENIFDLAGLVDVEKEKLLDTTEKITFFIKASAETFGSGTVLSLKYDEVGWSPSRVAPRLTYVYKDALPVVKDFMVKPYEEDPFYPEYSWETSDDDLWYGFIILDRESISHQYHKASLHIPLNEVPAETVNDTLGENNTNPFAKGEETFAYPYITGGTGEYTANTREASSVAVNLAPTIEGLAGNSLYFYGSTNTIDKQVLVFKYPLMATTNLSVLAHFTIDSLDSSSGRVQGIAQQTNNKGYIISAPEDTSAINNCYSIWVDSSGRVNAQVITKDLTADVTLVSKYIVPVGTGEPVCVILTVDTELAVGNVKLFINGKLEDQSGKKTVTGSSNNWKTGQDIGEADISIYVGSEAYGDTAVPRVASIKNMFNGTIEELVIYNHTIYPVIPTNGKIVLTKPIEEFTDSSDSAAGRPIVVKLFIKDYHNIRGTTPEEVTQTSQISVRKAGLGLKTST